MKFHSIYLLLFLVLLISNCGVDNNKLVQSINEKNIKSIKELLLDKKLDDTFRSRDGKNFIQLAYDSKNSSVINLISTALLREEASELNGEWLVKGFKIDKNDKGSKKVPVYLKFEIDNGMLKEKIFVKTKLYGFASIFNVFMNWGYIRLKDNKIMSYNFFEGSLMAIKRFEKINGVWVMYLQLERRKAFDKYELKRI